jgi:hypothetical protein
MSLILGGFLVAIVGDRVAVRSRLGSARLDGCAADYGDSTYDGDCAAKAGAGGTDAGECTRGRRLSPSQGIVVFGRFFRPCLPPPP